MATDDAKVAEVESALLVHQEVRKITRDMPPWVPLCEWTGSLHGVRIGGPTPNCQDCLDRLHLTKGLP